MSVGESETAAWRDAGLWHDALRDATDEELRRLAPDLDLPTPLLHGPAAAARLEADGERRGAVLEAVRWHTVGCARWDRTGRALYLADFLDPDRPVDRRKRAELAARVPEHFDDVFREVVRMRLEWALREGKRIFPQTTTLWNQLC